jgi:hypothetical protein
VNALIVWWCSVKPKAKWLILWSFIYFNIAVLLMFLDLFNWNWLVQMVWVFISSIPLWNKRLATWLNMNPKLSDWFKRKLTK